MKGWKTWLGAGLMALSTVVSSTMPQYAAIADVIMKAGEIFGLVGIGHKIERVGKI